MYGRRAVGTENRSRIWRILVEMDALGGEMEDRG